MAKTDPVPAPFWSRSLTVMTVINMAAVVISAVGLVAEPTGTLGFIFPQVSGIVFAPVIWVAVMIAGFVVAGVCALTAKPEERLRAAYRGWSIAGLVVIPLPGLFTFGLLFAL